MKYSIVQGITHPRLCEDLSKKNITFYDIGESKADVVLLQNLMKDILNPKLSKNIRHVMEDFFKSRAICIESDNKVVNNILSFFNEYEKFYVSKTGLNFYLVKREENKILNILDRWKCERQSKTAYAKSKRRNNKI